MSSYEVEYDVDDHFNYDSVLVHNLNTNQYISVSDMHALSLIDTELAFHVASYHSQESCENDPNCGCIAHYEQV